MITGATSGFGKAIATLFAAKGYDLIITGRRKERLDHLQQELQEQYNVQVNLLSFDVRDKEQVQESMEILSKTIPSVDILVNNAGLASGLAPIDEGDIDDWELMIDTNIKGLLYVTKQALPLLKNSRAPHIFNIGSTAGKMAYKNGNVYSKPANNRPRHET